MFSKDELNKIKLGITKGTTGFGGQQWYQHLKWDLCYNCTDEIMQLLYKFKKDKNMKKR